MILKCTSFEEMSKEITKRNLSIVILGAGVIGTITTPEILKQYHLLQRVSFYIDNNQAAQETKLTVHSRQIDIKPLERLKDCAEHIALILAISRYAKILEQLEQMACTKNTLCYIMPMMCIHNFCSAVSAGSPILSDKPLIPKKIHYMWLGKQAIPDKLQKCIDSWKRYCPDYEIIRWDESNYDIAKTAYMKEAYEAGAYGFVPDYARLDILYHNGGIYMDTDVEVRKNLDSLLYQEAFCGVEKWQALNFGGCSGAVKEQSMLRKLLEARAKIPFIGKDGKQNRTTCGFYDTRVAIEHGYILDGTTQNINGMNIYASDYFHPYDYMSGRISCTEHTYSVHWFNGGWLEEKMKLENEKTALSFDRIYRLSLKNQKDC